MTTYLASKEDKDKVQLNTELKELIRVIDHDKKLKEFIFATFSYF